MRIPRATTPIAMLLATAAAHLSLAAESAAAPAPGNPNASAGCLPAGDGFLRARIRGALSLDVNWHNAELECDGGARPNGSGIRLSFAGPQQSDGRRLRLVFGIASTAEGTAGKALPTNLTVIFEGEQRLFSTRGQDRCTVDSLRQERIGALGGPTRTYRVLARGFCIDPVGALSSNETIVVNSFDFAGRIVFAQPQPDAREPSSAPAATTARKSKEKGNK
jgi:hypothetical protein